MIKNRTFKNIYLILLFFILIISFFVQNIYLALLCGAFCYFGILFFDNDTAYGLVIMLLPLSGMFDACGFMYLFNISIWVLAFRLIVDSFIHNKLSNSFWQFFLLFLIIIYDLSIAIFNNMNLLSYLNNLSLWFGYIVLILSSEKISTIDKKKIYLYSLSGFLLGAGLAASQVYFRWGTNVPDMYRFTGLFRDPNYFALLGIILFIGAFILYKNYKKFLFSMMVIIISLFSVSKMLVFMIVIALVMLIFRNLYYSIKNGFKLSYKYIYILLGIIVAYVVLNNTGILDIFISKYMFRFTNYDLTTGRDYLQGTFLNIFFSDTSTFLLGKSLDYNLYFMISYADSSSMVAHNTYLDILLSFGLFGTILYLSLLVSIIKKYTINNKFGIDFAVLMASFLAVLFALSYLKADNFTVEILFIVIISKKDSCQCYLDEYENVYDYKENKSSNF